MNKHLPPQNVKELGTIPAGTIGAREQFIVIRGDKEVPVNGRRCVMGKKLNPKRWEANENTPKFVGRAENE